MAQGWTRASLELEVARVLVATAAREHPWLLAQAQVRHTIVDSVKSVLAGWHVGLGLKGDSSFLHSSNSIALGEGMFGEGMFGEVLAFLTSCRCHPLVAPVQPAIQSLHVREFCPRVLSANSSAVWLWSSAAGQFKGIKQAL